MTIYYALKRNRIILSNSKTRAIIDEIMKKYSFSRQQRVAVQNAFRINMVEAMLLLRDYKRGK